MFEFIRSHRRWMHVVLLLLIVPSFLFFGLEGYSRLKDDQSTLAKVDGQAITQPMLDQAQRQRADQLRQMMGEQFDARLVETPAAKKAILDELIDSRVLRAQARKKYIVVSDEQLRKTIAAIPAVQQDGKFNTQRYRDALASIGVTPNVFESQLRQDLAVQQVIDPLLKSLVLPETSVLQLARVQAERRTIKTLALPIQETLKSIVISDKQIETEYKKNAQRFLKPETVDIQYVVFSESELARKLKIEHSEIEQFYQTNLPRFQNGEERQARHILLKYPEKADSAARQAIQLQAKNLLMQLHKQPDMFAKLAKQYSQDPGSAQVGGDLGWFGKGAMVGPFENAVFALKNGELSNPVETEFGIHLIQVTGIRPATARTLAEVQSEIEAQLRQEKARKQFSEGIDGFTNLVYEQADSLQPVVERFGLTVQTASRISRNADALSTDAQSNTSSSGSDSLLKSTDLREALFSEDVVRNHHNTKAIETAKGQLVAARVIQHAESKTEDLANVSDLIKSELALKAAISKTEQQAQSLLANLQKGQALPGNLKFSEAFVVSRAEPAKNQVFQVTQTAFKMPANQYPAYAIADAGAQGLWLIQLMGIEQKEASAGASAVRVQWGRDWDEATRQALIQTLRADTKLKINHRVGTSSLP